MSLVFTPHKIGKLEIKNRFVHSATYECMAEENGKVADGLIRGNSNKGVGLWFAKMDAAGCQAPI